MVGKKMRDVLSGECKAKEYWEKNLSSIALSRHKRRIGFPFFVPVMAEGAYIVDFRGKKYLDFTAQDANIGYNHPQVREAIMKNLLKGGKNIEPLGTLAEKLKGMIAFDRSNVLCGFARSGTLAAEYTILMLRRCSARRLICAFQGSYHGSALCSFSLTLDRAEMRAKIYPFMPDVIYMPYAYCYRCPFGQEYPDCGFQCVEYIQYIMDTVAFKDDILAWFLEPIQSHSGVVVPPDGFLEKVSRLCNENHIFLVSDEVVTGLGRTGKMFGFEHLSVCPDVIFLGKPLGHPLPLGAVIGKKEIMKNYESPTDYPICAAAAIANIEIILKEKLAENALRMGNYLMKRLRELQEKYEVIGDVRGKGLLVGIELVKNQKKPAIKETRMVHLQAYKNGLLLMLGGTYLNCFRLAPPLNITVDQIDEAVNILDKAFRISLHRRHL
jgi:4-aminobutyrate aminotransferase-like enzyme